MKSLRKKQNDTQADIRTVQTRGYIGRIIYLCLLAVFIFSLMYVLFGNRFFLSADGIVLMDRYSVSVSYPGKITEVYVKEGDKVEAGAPLIRIESFDIVRELSDIAYRDSELAIRAGQLEGKLNSIEAVYGLAEQTAHETASTAKDYTAVSDRGIVSSLAKDDALRNSLAAAERLAQLKSDKVALAKELDLVNQSRKVTQEGMDKLAGIYDDGYLRASMGGVVGAKVPVPGQVVKAGDELAEINGGKWHVLAYLPDEYLFDLSEGMPVNISGGGQSVKGHIDAILTVATSLPVEFQNTFRPRDRPRLLRIAIDGKNPFAISQKVSISGCAFGFCWASAAPAE